MGRAGLGAGSAAASDGDFVLEMTLSPLLPEERAESWQTGSSGECFLFLGAIYDSSVDFLEMMSS